MIMQKNKRCNERAATRLRLWWPCLVVLSLLAAACATATPQPDVQNSPLVVASPLPSATLAAPTATAMPTATPLPPAVQLVVLHTNDNWGETEPCG
jgi:hypothetical protein